MHAPAPLAATLTIAALLAAPPTSPARDGGPEVVDAWRYTLTAPADGWQRPGFDDSAWKVAPGGFGTRGTPDARIGTEWDTDHIWLRKVYPLDALPDRPALHVYHDEDAEVYLNGTQVADFDGYVTNYKTVPLSEKSARCHEGGRGTCWPCTAARRAAGSSSTCT